MANEEAGSALEHASVALFAPITAPVLRSVDPQQVAKFLKERERYELEVEAKQAEVPALTLVPYTASIDRTLLKHLVFMGAFDEIQENATVETLSDVHIKTYIDSLVTTSEDEVDPSRIREALKGLKFPVKIASPSARIMTYCADVFERLDAVGYGDFKTNNPKHMIKLLLEGIRPPALKTAMEERIKVEAGLEKNVRLFIQRLKTDAAACQAFGQQVHSTDPGSSSAGAAASNRGGHNRHSKSNNTSSDNRNNKQEKDGVVCLYPPHKARGIKHKLKDCKTCPEEDKPKLIEEYFKERREKKKEAKRVQHTPAHMHGDNSESSIVFKTVFAHRHEMQTCVDNGSDGNIMDEKALQSIIQTGAEVEVKSLKQPRVFEMAAHVPDGKKAELVCKKEAVIDTELHIRHGSSLLLRNVAWLVTNQQVETPLLGRPIQEALGLNTRELLEAAADRFAGGFDAERMLASLTKQGDGRVSRITEGVFHSEGGEQVEDDAIMHEWCDMGQETDEEWETELASRLAQAKSKGLSTNGCRRLEKLLRENRNIVRIRYNGGPAAKVRPLELRTVEGAAPVRAKPRRYPPEKRQFLRKYVAQLLKLGLVKPAEHAEWVAAPLIVPKKPPAMYRMTMDYRPINKATIKNTWPMPHIDAVINDVQGAVFFAIVDFCSSYWQLPLHKDSQALHAFMTPDGVMQPTRTTQGGCNSAANFQACVEPCFGQLRGNLLAWLDDFALYAPSEERLLDILDKFLQICSTYNLVISLPKSTFFAPQINWCGRLIDASGVRMDPSSYSGMVDASEPESAGELCEYIHGMAWMSNAIPRFAERSAPLYSVLEEAYRISGKRTKKSIARIPLSKLGWGPEQSETFKQLQHQLQEMVKTAHRDPALRLCIYTDASDSFWAAAVTQCPDQELRKPVSDQQHDPLAFLSGAFNATQQHWSTFEKEAFAVVETFRRLNYMLSCSNMVSVFTDHRNLLFTFHPTALEPSLGRHKVFKVVRWALFLSAFSYRIEHVPGELNIIADIMTRWMRGYRRRAPHQRVARLECTNGACMVPTAPTKPSEWPSRTTLKAAQNGHEPPRGSTTDEDGLLRVDGKVWVPKGNDEMKIKLLTIAHAGQAGHRGADATVAAIREEFVWNGVTTDAREFVSNCLLCVLSRSGSAVPRPLSQTLHATKPNDVLHFDYLFLGKSTADDKYVFVLKDDFSGYAWVTPTSNATAEHAAETLARWQRTFTAPCFWVSDQGPHFINEVLSTMANTFNIQHKPTVAYSPWVNGTVERLNRDILAALRSLLAELKLGPQDWPAVINILPTILNEASEERLGKNSDGTTRSPLQVMTGIRPRRLLVEVMTGQEQVRAPLSIERAVAERLCDLPKLQESLALMHKEVHELVEARRQRSIEAHNAATNVVVPRFQVGDFVVVAKPKKPPHKLSFTWCGPRRVVTVKSPAVCVVQDLVTNKSETVHVARMKKYCGALDDTEVPKEVLDLVDRSTSKYEVVDQIVDLRKVDNVFWLRVRWDGLPEPRDYTWATLEDLFEDIPDMVQEYLRMSTKRKLAHAAATSLNLII